MYFKENLPIRERKDLEFPPETMMAESKLDKKKIFLFSLTATLISQTMTLANILKNPTITILLSLNHRMVDVCIMYIMVKNAK